MIDLFPILTKMKMDPVFIASLAMGVSCGVCVGWYFRGRTIGVVKTASAKRVRRNTNSRSRSSSTPESSDISSDEDTQNSRNIKYVICVRQDLKMGKGKIAAQCSHAAVSTYKQLMKRNTTLLKQWEYNGQPKVVLKCANEEELLALYQHARVLGLTTSIIQDAGHTQVMPGSKTVLGVGPGPDNIVNKVTSHLKLL